VIPLPQKAPPMSKALSRATAFAPGLRFVLADGTLDHLGIMTTAASRACIHINAYEGDGRLAYDCELDGVYSEADGELQIWGQREINAGRASGILIEGYAARELATDLPLGSAA
jgi:hypothetical protein